MKMGVEQFVHVFASLHHTTDPFSFLELIAGADTRLGSVCKRVNRKRVKAAFYECPCHVQSVFYC